MHDEDEVKEFCCVASEISHDTDVLVVLHVPGKSVTLPECCCLQGHSHFNKLLCVLCGDVP